MLTALVPSLFQNKLQEDFDTVQTMLEEKDREIESLTKELTDRSPTQSDEHSLVVRKQHVSSQTFLS